MLSSAQMLCITLVLLGAGFLAAFIIKCRKQRSVGGVFLKNTVSMLFILTAVSGIYQDPLYVRYGVLVVIGLVFGMLGDIYLDQKWVYPKDDKMYLNAGFISFGIGHFFYIAALYTQAGLSAGHLLIALAVGVVVAVGNLILEKPMGQNFGSFRFIVTVYGFILATMAALAVVCAVVTKQTAFIVYAVGGVLFVISDLILSPMYFAKGKNTPVNFVLNHLTYYVGQYMIALSVILLASAGHA